MVQIGPTTSESCSLCLPRLRHLVVFRQNSGSARDVEGGGTGGAGRHPCRVPEPCLSCKQSRDSGRSSSSGPSWQARQRPSLFVPATLRHGDSNGLHSSTPRLFVPATAAPPADVAAAGRRAPALSSSSSWHTRCSCARRAGAGRPCLPGRRLEASRGIESWRRAWNPHKGVDGVD